MRHCWLAGRRERALLEVYSRLAAAAGGHDIFPLTMSLLTEEAGGRETLARNTGVPR